MKLSKPLKLVGILLLALGGVLLCLEWVSQREKRSALEAAIEATPQRGQQAVEVVAPQSLEPLVEADRKPAPSASVKPLVVADAVGVLAVTMVFSDTLHLVSDCEVHIRQTEIEPGAVGFSETLLTDSNGECTVEVPAGLGLTVEAGGASRSCSLELISATYDLDAIGAGERFEFFLQVAAAGEFWARVVDEQTGEPLSGTIVRKDGGFPSGFAQHPGEGEVLTRSDGAGLFSLELSLEGSEQIHALENEGYGTALFTVTPTHQDSAGALVLPMRRTATLEIQVADRGVPGAGPSGQVEFTTDSYQLAVPDGVFLMVTDPVWESELTLDGRCEIALPSRVPLQATVTVNGREEEISEALTLEPGERRAIEWRFEEGAMVEGQLLDQEDAPVGGHEIWITSRSVGNGTAEGQRMFNGLDGEKALSMTMTDEQGRFRFEDVPAGGWWVGPRALAFGGAMSADSIVPVAQGIEVKEGMNPMLTLRTWRGLSIRGHVFDPFGDPAGGESVSASGLKWGGYISARTASDGSFTVGPLAPGEWKLRSGFMGRHAAAEPVIARDGEEGVVLNLRESGSIRGKLFDESNLSWTDLELWVSHRGEANRRGESIGADGEFFCEGLEPGIYDLAASGTDGRAGVQASVEVFPGKESGPVLIELRVGARLTIRYTGPTTYANYDVYSGEVPVAFDGIHTGTSATQTVPAGALRVEVKTRNGLHQVQEIDVTAGEVREVVFEF